MVFIIGMGLSWVVLKAEKYLMEVSSALDDLWAPPSNYIKKAWDQSRVLRLLKDVKCSCLY